MSVLFKIFGVVTLTIGALVLADRFVDSREPADIKAARAACMKICGERWYRSFDLNRNGRVDCYCNEREHHY